MWNSSSDNKKSEDLEDCSCSSRSSGGSSESSVNTGAGSSTSAIAAVVVSATPTTQQKQQQQQQQQQQKLNSFDNTTAATATTITKATISSENNSNISTKSSGGQEFKNDFSKLEEGATAETIDSGFISGPQTNPCISEDEEEDNARAEEDKQQQQQPTKTVNKQLNIAAHVEEDRNVVPDSGIIDEDFDDEDEDIAEYEEQHKNKESEQEQHDHQAATKGTFSQQLAEGNSAVATVATAATAKADNQMILKQNVDAGMSEWFCNLSLQTTPTSENQQQQQQQQQQQRSQQTIAGMNNLNGAGQRITINAVSNATSSRQQQQQQQPKAAGNSATTTTTTTPTITNITPSNAWEKFYQQNDDGDTPLHLACISGYEEVVAALIRMAPHPCLFNIQNDEAQTALHLAVLTAQPKILRMLLIAGAEPTIRDRHGNTALHLACISGEEQCVRALTIPISASEINEAHRQYGHRSNDKTVSYLNCARLPSDLEIRNYDGERCVHLAAQAGHIDVLRSLVLYGADINAREGKSGRTPLHIAIECCNEDLANFLLDECSKLNLETATYAGLTAYQVACILNKSQMQNILEKRGAEPLTPPDSDYDSDIDSDIEDSKIYDRFGDPGYFISSHNGGNFMTVA